MTETLDLARTNIASGVKEDDLKPIQKLNILSFALASDARDSHHGYIRPWECPPPPPALLTQDSMPRERRHLAGGTREGGSG